MDGFKKKLNKRSTIEIGNKLADRWLTELHSGKLPEGEDMSEDDDRAQPRPVPRNRKRKAPSPIFDADESEDEYHLERPQRKASEEGTYPSPG